MVRCGIPRKEMSREPYSLFSFARNETTLVRGVWDLRSDMSFWGGGVCCGLYIHFFYVFMFCYVFYVPNKVLTTTKRNKSHSVSVLHTTYIPALCPILFNLCCSYGQYWKYGFLYIVNLIMNHLLGMRNERKLFTYIGFGFARSHNRIYTFLRQRSRAYSSTHITFRNY